MKYFVAGFAMSCGALAVAVYQLGQSWLTIGHGIHPMLAGAFVLFLIVAPCCMASLCSYWEE